MPPANSDQPHRPTCGLYIGPFGESPVPIQMFPITKQLLEMYPTAPTRLRNGTVGYDFESFDSAVRQFAQDKANLPAPVYELWPVTEDESTCSDRPLLDGDSASPAGLDIDDHVVSGPTDAEPDSGPDDDGSDDTNTLTDFNVVAGPGLAKWPHAYTNAAAGTDVCLWRRSRIVGGPFRILFADHSGNDFSDSVVKSFRGRACTHVGCINRTLKRKPNPTEVYIHRGDVFEWHSDGGTSDAQAVLTRHRRPDSIASVGDQCRVVVGKCRQVVSKTPDETVGAVLILGSPGKASDEDKPVSDAAPCVNLLISALTMVCYVDRILSGESAG